MFAELTVERLHASAVVLLILYMMKVVIIVFAIASEQGSGQISGCFLAAPYLIACRYYTTSARDLE